MLKGYIKEERAAAYEAKRRKELSDDYKYREVRSASIYLTRGREITARNFTEAMNLPVGEDELAVGFSAILRVGEIQARVNSGYRFNRQITVDVEPNDTEVALSLFGALSNWVSDIEAPKWKQKWRKYREVPGFLLLLLLTMGLVAVPLSNWSEAGKNAAKEEPRKLLATNGVNSTNEQQAIQLLLTIGSDYRPASARVPPLGLKYWTSISLAAVILLAATIYPGMCIGLWKGKRRLEAWRVWMRTLEVGIPVLIGTYVLIPWLLYWLKLVPPNP